MGLTLLLTLAALAAAPPDPVPPGGARPAARPGASFQVEPLQLGPPALRPFRVVPNAAETQLRRRRPRVVCTMRIWRLSAEMDPRILIRAPRLAEPDPSVRDDLGPCSE